MATHSSILAWRIPQRSLVGYSPWGRKELDTTEHTSRTGHGTADWFQIGKGVRQGCILSPCLFNLYAEYIMRNAGLEEAQAGIKIAKRNINNIRYADDTTLMAQSESPLDCKEIQSVHSKGDQFWVFFGRNDAKAETPVLWPPYAKSWQKTLMLGGIGGRRRRGRQRMRWLDGITDSMDVSLSELRSWWWTGRPGVLQFMGSQGVGHDWATELNWSDLTCTSVGSQFSTQGMNPGRGSENIESQPLD